MRQGMLMRELAQTTGNLVSMASNLSDLVKRRQFAAYASDEMRQAVSKAIAIESSRGSRLAKSKASDRIDPIIALAMACLVAVQAGSPVLSESDRQFIAAARAQLAAQAERNRGSTIPSLRPPAASRLDGRGEDWDSWEDNQSRVSKRHGCWRYF
jgi:hypothetical protein